MISYQMFTEVSMLTIVNFLNNSIPSLGTWLLTRIDVINFIHNFAWVFVLSSIIPSILLGKERSIIVHFLFCLTFTFLSTWIRDVVFESSTGGLSNQVTIISSMFHNLPVAILYICTPYVIMLVLDTYANRLRVSRREEMIRSIKIPSSR